MEQGRRGIFEGARMKADINPYFDHLYEAGSGTAARVLLLLHGTGGDEGSLMDVGRSLDAEAHLLSPRGKVKEHGTINRFFRRVSEGVFDIPDLIARTGELADFVTSAVEYYGLSQSEIVAVGYSNGANIAAAMLLLRPGILSRAILYRGMYPLTPETLPTLNDTSVLLLNGEADPIVPHAQVDQLRDLLTSVGAEVQVHWESAGHNLTAEDIRLSSAWLNRKKW